MVVELVHQTLGFAVLTLLMVRCDYIFLIMALYPPTLMVTVVIICMCMCT